MSEESVTIMLQQDDDTETILEKVRRAGAEKVSLIVPPGTRALQTLGGFTMLRKACDLTGIDLTVYSVDEKTCDMAKVCRFEVVSLDQEVRPREVPPVEEELPRIVVSTRPPEPTREPVAVPAGAEERPAELQERLGGLSEADLALFDALEGMSMGEDVEISAATFARPAPAVEVREERPIPRREERPPKKKKPSPFRFILDPLANALANVYIAVVSLVLRVTQRFTQRREEVARAVVTAGAEGEEAPSAGVGLRLPTGEEAQLLRAAKRRYYLWTLAAVGAFVLFMVAVYLLLQPKVTISLKPRAAETRQVALSLTVVLTETVGPKAGITGETPTIPAQQVSVELSGSASTAATGSTTIPEGTATGTVVFVNQTLYGVSVLAGTRVSGGGATFHTTQDVWVPPSDNRGIDAYYGIAQVNVIADAPGSAGNVPAGAIAYIEDSSLAGVLTVENTDATAGGSERIATVVSAEDVERLRQQLVADLQAQAYAELQAKLVGLEVLSGTLEVTTVEETFSHGVGSEVDVLTLTARVRASALATAPGLLDQAVAGAVEQQIGEIKAGQEVGSIEHGALKMVAPAMGLNAWTYATTATVPILNTIDEGLKGEVAGAVRGKTYQEAYKILEGYGDRIAAFSISPVLSRLPSLGGIDVVDTTRIR